MLEHCDCDQHGFASKATHPILLCSGKRHFIALSPAWQSWQVVLNFNHIYKTKKQKNIFSQTAITWHLQKQVRIIVCLMYSTSVAFLSVRKIKYRDEKKSWRNHSLRSQSGLPLLDHLYCFQRLLISSSGMGRQTDRQTEDYFVRDCYAL